MVVNFPQHIVHMGRVRCFEAGSCMFVMGVGSDFGVVWGVVVAEDQPVVGGLVVVGVIGFKNDELLFNQMFHKFEHRIIPKPQPSTDNYFLSRHNFMNGKVFNCDFSPGIQNILDPPEMSLEFHVCLYNGMIFLCDNNLETF